MSVWFHALSNFLFEKKIQYYWCEILFNYIPCLLEKFRVILIRPGSFEVSNIQKGNPNFMFCRDSSEGNFLLGCDQFPMLDAGWLEGCSTCLCSKLLLKSNLRIPLSLPPSSFKFLYFFFPLPLSPCICCSSIPKSERKGCFYLPSKNIYVWQIVDRRGTQPVQAC